MNDYTLSFETSPITTTGLRISDKPVFSTTTARTIDGHVGQVLVHDRIVWQSRPKKQARKARAAADARLAKKLAEVFA